jgi:glycerophosphoryl diester phosphodiesterase
MTRITGHRGARGLWPENSLVGFRKAITLGLDAIEFDVHLAASGELLVIHDAMLGRTTDGSGPVHALSPADRAGIRLNDSDETIPTLGDVLSVLGSGVGTALHVELKSDPDGHPYPGIAERVIAEIDRYGLRARCHLASFDITTLEECRRLAPDIPRLISVDATYADRQGGLAPFLALVDDLVDIVAIHHRLLDAQWDETIATIAADRLCVWTINDEERIRDWLDRGVGHLTSDRPDLALAVRDER